MKAVLKCVKSPAVTVATCLVTASVWAAVPVGGITGTTCPTSVNPLNAFGSAPDGTTSYNGVQNMPTVLVPAQYQPTNPVSNMSKCVDNANGKYYGQVLSTVLGSALNDVDSNGNSLTHVGCLFSPHYSSKPTGSPQQIPLVVYLHPSYAIACNVGLGCFDASAGLVKGFTNSTGSYPTLLANIDSQASPYVPAHPPGYFVLAPQARWVNPPTKLSGFRWDIWYRQMNKSSQTAGGYTYQPNIDAAAIDSLINKAITAAQANASANNNVTIDPNRIYVIGWSDGAAFAYLYALNRNTIAATAVYSAPNPFASMDDPCEQVPISGSSTPVDNTQVHINHAGANLYQVHPGCDYTSICPNTSYMESQEILSLQSQGSAGTGNVTDYIINDTQGYLSGPTIVYQNGAFPKCDSTCGTNNNGDSTATSSRSFNNHTTWPTNWIFGVPQGAPAGTQSMFDYLWSKSL